MTNTSISATFFIIPTIIVLSIQKPSVISCDKYRKGKFSQFIYNKSGLGHWTKQEVFIERGDSIQTEIIQMFPNDTLFFRISWTNDCNYQLRFFRATNSTTDSIYRYYNRKSAKNYTIRNGTELYYIEKSGRKKDTIWLRQ